MALSAARLPRRRLESYDRSTLLSFIYWPPLKSVLISLRCRIPLPFSFESVAKFGFHSSRLHRPPLAVSARACQFLASHLRHIALRTTFCKVNIAAPCTYHAVLCCGFVLCLCHVHRAKGRSDSDPVIRARRTWTKAGVAWSASEQRESWFSANSRLKSPLVTQIRIGARLDFPREASSLPPCSPPHRRCNTKEQRTRPAGNRVDGA